MRIVTSCLIILLLFADFAQASSCPPRKVLAPFAAPQVGKVTLSPALKTKLVEGHQKWLRTRARVLADLDDVPSLNIDRIYELGWGYEGTVYLIHREKKIEALKIFHEHIRAEVMEDSVNQLNKLREAGVPVPEIRKLKMVENYVLLEYVEGFSVDKLLEGNSLDAWVELTHTERAELWEKFYHFDKACIEATSKQWRPRMPNTILDLPNERFVIVDPY